MYNDPNYNQKDTSEENGEYSHTTNGYTNNERVYHNNYDNSQESNGYQSTDYNSSNNYSEHTFSTSHYSDSSNLNNDYSGSHYSGNNSYSGNDNYTDQNEYNANSYTHNDNGYGSDSPQYMDLLDKTERLASENEDLQSSKKALRITLVIFLLLFVASAAYIVLSEVKEPLFGKWPAMAREYEQMAMQVDTLNQIKHENDSLREVNNILVENVTPPEQRGVFFEVQIGAFQNFDLQKYMEDLARLQGGSAEGMNKYVLGRFRDYKRAAAFKDDVQRMGVNDAFIVATIDGQRVDIKEAIKASKRVY